MADSIAELSDAAQHGNLARVVALLDAQPGFLNMPDSEGWTALHLASYFGREDVARTLLERGAEVHFSSLNTMRNQPMHAAAAGRHAGIVALILDAGGDPNARQVGGWTPLHAAAQNGQRELVELLLARGADASLLSESGMTPFALAEERNHHNVAALLRTEAV
ncbi:MAG: ankyrin repeat domain-containing protein [Gemmatimonadota bacterium]